MSWAKGLRLFEEKGYAGLLAANYVLGLTRMARMIEDTLQLFQAFSENIMNAWKIDSEMNMAVM